jgi:hypothetical protein
MEAGLLDNKSGGFTFVIETIQGFPDNVVAVAAKGHVTRADYETVLIPKVESTLKRFKKMRLYYELGSEFAGIAPGAAWEDFKVGVEHLGSWQRAAIVTDVEWIRHMANAFRFLMPGHMRVFATADKAAAKTWLLEGES